MSDLPTGGSGAERWIAECDTLVTTGGYRVAYRRRGRGPTVLLLHGFPTWSYEYATVAEELAGDHDVVTLDFLGYGASDKPDPHQYRVSESADIVEALAAHLHLGPVALVAHDYGGIVAQELLDRRRRGTLGVTIASVTILNSGIVYAQYRPRPVQRLLAVPVLGRLVARRVTPQQVRSGLDAVRGTVKTTDEEFAGLWVGISRDDGHRLTHLLIAYNAEREVHHARWEAALRDWDGPLSLVWGLADPVSGAHVLDVARSVLPRARVTALDDVGHYPQSEAPDAVAAAIRKVA